MAAIESAYLTLAEARALIDSAISEATTNGETASVVIVDVGGWIAAAARADDASLDSLEMARQWAHLCARDKVLSSEISQAETRPFVKGGRTVAGIGIVRHKIEGRVNAPLPLGLAAARRYSDRAIEEAGRAACPIGVAVVDELGRLVCVERMDGSSLGSCEMAEAKAMTACKFRRPTADLKQEFIEHSARMAAIEKMLGFTILAMGGGIPISRDG